MYGKIYYTFTYCWIYSFFFRFVNLTSFFITQAVVVKLTDLRFVCELNGHKRSTICGDPLYFSPEMVGQTGYNYGADLWALGIAIFELFEGENSHPFGDEHTAETDIFNAISHFNPSILKFVKCPSDAQKLVFDLVQLSQNDRLGYKNPSDVMNHSFLSGTSVSDSSGIPLPLEVSTDVDISSFAVVKSTKSDIFDLYSK